VIKYKAPPKIIISLTPDSIFSGIDTDSIDCRESLEKLHAVIVNDLRNAFRNCKTEISLSATRLDVNVLGDLDVADDVDMVIYLLKNAIENNSRWLVYREVGNE